MPTVQHINLGGYANDGTGDDLRTAFTKVNANFALLDAEAAISSAVNLGTGIGIFADKNAVNLEFKSLTSTDGSILFTSTAQTVNLKSVTNLFNDTLPSLSTNLNLNNFHTYGGDIQNTIYGQDPNIATGLFSAIMPTTNLVADFGTITYPTGYQRSSRGYTVDMNGTSVISGILNPPNNDYDFGNLNANQISANGYFLTLGTNLTTTGSGNITLNVTGNSNVILPTNGTLATTASTLNQFANTSSSQLASIISDSTGVGNLVFSTTPSLTSPDISTSITTPSTTFNIANTVATTVSAYGAATTINEGAAGVTKYIGQNTGNTTLSLLGNTSAGTATLTTNVTTGTANVFAGVTGTINIGATGSTVVHSNLAINGLTLRAVNFITVSSTSVYALSTTVSYNVLIVSSTGYTATITLPPNPVDTQMFSFTVASNTVTLAMTAGPTIVPSFTGSATSGTVYTYVYSNSRSTWYRI